MAPSFLACRWWLLLAAYWVNSSSAAGQQAPRRARVATRRAGNPRQTLYPDTLHARPLAVAYWTRAQVDSIQQSLGTTRRERAEMLKDSTARYRVLRSEDYSDLRLFYSPLATPTHWIEFDLNPWFKEHDETYNELAYLQAYVVQLDQRAPEEVMVKMGGGIYGSGYRTIVDHTLLLSLDGPPRLLWQSVDGRVEEVIPSLPSEGEEMAGGNYAERQRTVAMRKGLVYVSKVRKAGQFKISIPRLTPIIPGYYQYQAGHFRRVAPPPRVLKIKKPQPTG